MQFVSSLILHRMWGLSASTQQWPTVLQKKRWLDVWVASLEDNVTLSSCHIGQGLLRCRKGRLSLSLGVAFGPAELSCIANSACFSSSRGFCQSSHGGEHGLGAVETKLKPRPDKLSEGLRANAPWRLGDCGDHHKLKLSTLHLSSFNLPQLPILSSI